MSIEGLIVSTALAVLVALWIGFPWLRGERRQAEISTVERQRERLTVYYSRVLRNIHDLDEDYATGKLNPDEYGQEREAWVARGVAALKALDELDAAHPVVNANADDTSVDEAIDDAIEAAVRRAKAEV
jgi:aminoglycoside phosphotransferase (APT) family kinase protein